MELGKEISKTEQFKELERVTQNMDEDTAASKMIKDIQELQQQMQKLTLIASRLEEALPKHSPKS